MIGDEVRQMCGGRVCRPLSPSMIRTFLWPCMPPSSICNLCLRLELLLIWSHASQLPLQLLSNYLFVLNLKCIFITYIDYMCVYTYKHTYMHTYMFIISLPWFAFLHMYHTIIVTIQTPPLSMEDVCSQTLCGSLKPWIVPNPIHTMFFFFSMHTYLFT